MSKVLMFFMSVAIISLNSVAYAQTSSAPAASLLDTLLPLVVVFGMFYALNAYRKNGGIKGGKPTIIAKTIAKSLLWMVTLGWFGAFFLTELLPGRDFDLKFTVILILTFVCIGALVYRREKRMEDILEGIRSAVRGAGDNLSSTSGDVIARFQPTMWYLYKKPVWGVSLDVPQNLLRTVTKNADVVISAGDIDAVDLEESQSSKTTGTGSVTEGFFSDRISTKQTTTVNKWYTLRIVYYVGQTPETLIIPFGNDRDRVLKWSSAIKKMMELTRSAPVAEESIKTVSAIEIEHLDASAKERAEMEARIRSELEAEARAKIALEQQPETEDEMRERIRREMEAVPASSN